MFHLGWLSKGGVSSMTMRTRGSRVRGDGTVRRPARHVYSATVVIDPKLPRYVRDTLMGAAGSLVPYQGPVPAPTSAGQRCPWVHVPRGGLLHPGRSRASGRATARSATRCSCSPGTGLLVTMLGRPSAREIEAAHAPVTQHRRYVLPSTTSTPSTGSCGSERSTRGTGSPDADVVNAGASTRCRWPRCCRSACGTRGAAGPAGRGACPAPGDPGRCPARRPGRGPGRDQAAAGAGTRAGRRGRGG